MLLSLRNIYAKYGFINALKDVSINIQEGKVVALLGSNGAGKSTTLKVISGILKPAGGQIEYNGEILNKCTPEEIVRKGIVQVPEGRQIFSDLTVQENLIVGAYTQKDKKEVTATLKRLEEHFPVLGQRRKQQAGTLSGGEQQMLAIARALMAKPKILLLDEPSLGLAPLMVKEIFAIIKEISEKGTTILLVEQNAFQALAIADYAYVLETGRIVVSGPAEEIKNNETIKAAYLGGKTK
ncbi:MAG: ABC transporter ATP-binding protein [Peptococcia bacterium]